MNDIKTYKLNQFSNYNQKTNGGASQEVLITSMGSFTNGHAE